MRLVTHDSMPWARGQKKDDLGDLLEMFAPAIFFIIVAAIGTSLTLIAFKLSNRRMIQEIKEGKITEKDLVRSFDDNVKTIIERRGGFGLIMRSDNTKLKRDFALFLERTKKASTFKQYELALIQSGLDTGPIMKDFKKLEKFFNDARLGNLD